TQLSCFPSSLGSQMVQKESLPWDSTNRATMVSISERGDPAKINFRMSSTDSLENCSAWLCVVSSFDENSNKDREALSINYFPLLRSTSLLCSGTAIAARRLGDWE